MSDKEQKTEDRLAMSLATVVPVLMLFTGIWMATHNFMADTWIQAFFITIGLLWLIKW